MSNGDDREKDTSTTVIRREASSGNVSFSDPVIIHESSRKRVALVPFYIPRSDRTQLAFRIQTHVKAPPPNEWVISEGKSLSLDEAAARKLSRELRTIFAVAEEDADGDYIVLRVPRDGDATIGDQDAGRVAEALIRVLGQEEIRQHLQTVELSDELLNAFRGAIHLKEMQSAVAQLRHHLESGEAEESVYQDWCTRHSWAFGNAYVMHDDVRNISSGDRLDILLPTVISGYRDIVELKRPDVNVLLYDERHRNYYFSSEVSQAIGQCHRYLDVLHEEASNGLRDHPEVVAYHPRAIIVIGRSAGWDEEQLRALHGLHHRLSGITLMTYDQLLAQGERLIEILSSSTQDEEDDDLDAIFDDSDIPF